MLVHSKDELGDLTNVLGSLTDTITTNPGVNLDTLKLSLYRCSRACEEYEELIAGCTKHSTGSRPSIRNWITQIYLQGAITDYNVRTRCASRSTPLRIAPRL